MNSHNEYAGYVTFFIESSAYGLERGWYYRDTSSLHNKPVGPFLSLEQARHSAPVQARGFADPFPLAEVANNLVKRMIEIDKCLTKSAYDEDASDGSRDESPTGDDYNLLWDAILDEFHAVDVDIAGMIEAYRVR